MVGSGSGVGVGHGFFGSSGKHGVGTGVSVGEIVGDVVGVGVCRPDAALVSEKFVATPTAFNSSERPIIV